MKTPKPILYVDVEVLKTRKLDLEARYSATEIRYRAEFAASEVTRNKRAELSEEIQAVKDVLASIEKLAKVSSS